MQRPGSPFAAAAPSILLALGYGAAVLAWIAAGERLPGGRWFAVHLFTLGVLTNLVLTFSEHFARTLTRTPGERAWWWPLVTNAGILTVLAGMPSDNRWLVGTGATIVTWSVFAAYLRIRRMRHQAVGARFAWIVRLYERAHGAFIHGALLGALLGIGVVSGAWYGAVRTAHLHANVLGWGGLTLLATLVFFGPSMARARIEPGADARAARALRAGATGLTVAVVLLIATGAGGAIATTARLLAAASLAVLAVAATLVCLPVMRVVAAARPGAPRPLIIGACAWIAVVLWADVAVVASGRWWHLDALGAAAFTGALAQAILATLLYLAPMLRGRTNDARTRIRTRIDTGARTRAATFNTGVALVTLQALIDVHGAVGATGWGLLGASVFTAAVAALLPANTPATEPPDDRREHREALRPDRGEEPG